MQNPFEYDVMNEYNNLYRMENKLYLNEIEFQSIFILVLCKLFQYCIESYPIIKYDINLIFLVSADHYKLSLIQIQTIHI